MIVVPVKTKIYIFKVLYMDFLLPIASIIQTIHALCFLYPFYLKACQLNPNPQNGCNFKSDSMPLPNAWRQK